MRWLIALFVLGALVIAAALMLLWFQHTQGVTLPAPDGPYPVGRRHFDWRDPSRIDPFAPAAGTPRELTVWIWYPAASSSGPSVEYVPSRIRNATHTHPLIRFLTHNMAKVRAHAVADAPLANDRPVFPVLILKPGIGSLALEYTTIAEDLASHGYVVAASDSPYSTGVVVYDDGRVARSNRAGHPADEGLPEPSKATMDNVLRVWEDDDRFVADQLARIFPRLDLSSLGALGHSFGGAAAIQFCADDPRCRAAIDIDGIPFGTVADGAAVGKPMLFLLSDHGSDRSNQAKRVRATIQSIGSRLPNRPNVITLAGTRHFNFSDQALTKSTRVARLVGMIGPADERQALRDAAETIRKFFDRYLPAVPRSHSANAG